MVTTRANDEKAFKHVLTNVLGLKDDHQLAKSLSKGGYSEVRQLIAMLEDDIADLKYKDENGNEIALERPHKSLLHFFIGYYRSRAVKGTPIWDDWLSITKEEFKEYWLHDYWIAPQGTTSTTTAMPPPMT
jgi:hypothetical protein